MTFIKVLNQSSLSMNTLTSNTTHISISKHSNECSCVVFAYCIFIIMEKDNGKNNVCDHLDMYFIDSTFPYSA